MSTKIRSCMNALLSGYTISLKGQNYRLFKPGEYVETPSMQGLMVGQTEGFWLGYEMESSLTGKVYLGCETTFSDMLDLFETLTDEEAVLMGANAVLNEINKKDRSNIKKENS